MDDASLLEDFRSLLSSVVCTLGMNDVGALRKWIVVNGSRQGSIRRIALKKELELYILNIASGKQILNGENLIYAAYEASNSLPVTEDPSSWRNLLNEIIIICAPRVTDVHKEKIISKVFKAWKTKGFGTEDDIKKWTDLIRTDEFVIASYSLKQFGESDILSSRDDICRFAVAVIHTIGNSPTRGNAVVSNNCYSVVAASGDRSVGSARNEPILSQNGCISATYVGSLALSDSYKPSSGHYSGGVIRHQSMGDDSGGGGNASGASSLNYGRGSGNFTGNRNGISLGGTTGESLLNRTSSAAKVKNELLLCVSSCWILHNFFRKVSPVSLRDLNCLALGAILLAGKSENCFIRMSKIKDCAAQLWQQHVLSAQQEAADASLIIQSDDSHLSSLAPGSPSAAINVLARNTKELNPGQSKQMGPTLPVSTEFPFRPSDVFSAEAYLLMAMNYNCSQISRPDKILESWRESSQSMVDDEILLISLDKLRSEAHLLRGDLVLRDQLDIAFGYVVVTIIEKSKLQKVDRDSFSSSEFRAALKKKASSSIDFIKALDPPFHKDDAINYIEQLPLIADSVPVEITTDSSNSANAVRLMNFVAVSKTLDGAIQEIKKHFSKCSMCIKVQPVVDCVQCYTARRSCRCYTLIFENPEQAALSMRYDNTFYSAREINVVKIEKNPPPSAAKDPRRVITDARTRDGTSVAPAAYSQQQSAPSCSSSQIMNPQMQRIRTGPEPIELVVGPAVAAPNVEYILYLKKKDCEVKRAGFKNCSYCTHSSCQCWIVKIFDEEKERKVLQENDRFDKLKNIPIWIYPYKREAPDTAHAAADRTPSPVASLDRVPTAHKTHPILHYEAPPDPRPVKARNAPRSPRCSTASANGAPFCGDPVEACFAHRSVRSNSSSLDDTSSTHGEKVSAYTNFLNAIGRKRQRETEKTLKKEPQSDLIENAANTTPEKAVGELEKERTAPLVSKGAGPLVPSEASDSVMNGKPGHPIGENANAHHADMDTVHLLQEQKLDDGDTAPEQMPSVAATIVAKQECGELVRQSENSNAHHADMDTVHLFQEQKLDGGDTAPEQMIVNLERAKNPSLPFNGTVSLVSSEASNSIANQEPGALVRQSENSNTDPTGMNSVSLLQNEKSHASAEVIENKAASVLTKVTEIVPTENPVNLIPEAAGGLEKERAASLVVQDAMPSIPSEASELVSDRVQDEKSEVFLKVAETNSLADSKRGSKKCLSSLETPSSNANFSPSVMLQKTFKVVVGPVGNNSKVESLLGLKPAQCKITPLKPGCCLRCEKSCQCRVVELPDEQSMMLALTKNETTSGIKKRKCWVYPCEAENHTAISNPDASVLRIESKPKNDLAETNVIKDSNVSTDRSVRGQRRTAMERVSSPPPTTRKRYVDANSGNPQEAACPQNKKVTVDITGNFGAGEKAGDSNNVVDKRNVEKRKNEPDSTVSAAPMKRKRLDTTLIIGHLALNGPASPSPVGSNIESSNNKNGKTKFTGGYFRNK